MTKRIISVLTISLSLIIGGYISTTDTVSGKDNGNTVTEKETVQTEKQDTTEQKSEETKSEETKEEEKTEEKEEDKKTDTTTTEKKSNSSSSSTKKDTSTSNSSSKSSTTKKDTSTSNSSGSSTKKDTSSSSSSSTKKETTTTEPKKETTPEPEPTQPSSSVSNAQLNIINSQAIALVNSIRSSSLASNGTLNSYANTRAYEASVKWSHTRPNGTRGVNMIDASKYRGENLAKTVVYNYGGTNDESYAIATRLFNNWKKSSSHYANMVDNDFTQIGLKTYVVVEGNKYIFYTAAMFSN